MLVAERAAGLRLGPEAAGDVAGSAAGVPPPPAPFRSELDELAEMERLGLEAAGAHEEEHDNMEDVFGHMEEDFGADAKRPCRREEIAAEQLDEEALGPAPPQGAAEPPAKKRRLVGKQAPPCGDATGQRGPAVQQVVTVSPASLEGLELRLTKVGENPRFRASESGGLVHNCGSYRASVRFWPSTLTWCTEGPDCEKVEAMLLAPMPT